MDVKYYDKKKSFETDAVEQLIACVQQADVAVHIALSGGATPQPIYTSWAKRRDVDWSRVHLYVTDERCVSVDHAYSNQGMLRKALGERVIKQLAGFHTFDPKKQGADMEAALQDIPDGRLDLLLLGIGEDGHITSLFPGDPILDEQDLLCVRVENKNAPNPPVQDRLTMTYVPIMRAKQIMLLAQGKKKTTAMQRLLNERGSVHELPARRLLAHRDVLVHWQQ